MRTINPPQTELNGRPTRHQISIEDFERTSFPISMAASNTKNLSVNVKIDQKTHKAVITYRVRNLIAVIYDDENLDEAIRVYNSLL